MATQELERHTESMPVGKGGERSGFAMRRMLKLGSLPWRQTVTRHAPEPWPAARLSLQARIAALDGQA